MATNTTPTTIIIIIIIIIIDCGARAGLSQGCDGVLHNCQLLLGLLTLTMQPSWQHLTRWSLVKYAGLSSQGEFVPIAMEYHGPINRIALQFLSRRLAETFEHLRFCSNEFPLWFNVLIRFCCTMVLLMTTGQSRVHYQINFVISVIFEPPGFFSW